MLGWQWGGRKERHLGRTPVFRLKTWRGAEIPQDWDHERRHQFRDDSDGSRGTGRPGGFRPGDAGRMDRDKRSGDRWRE